MATEAVTFQVPGNGSPLKIIYYAQGNTGGGSEWASVPFGGQDIAHSGCSITSLAMVVSYFQSAIIKPSDIRQKIQDVYGDYNHFYSGDAGQSWDIFPSVAKQYSMSCSQIEKSQVVSALSSGCPVIQSCSNYNKCYYTKHGHFIVLTGEANGVMHVNDPSHPLMSFDNKSSSFVLDEGKAWWKFTSSLKPKGTYSGTVTYTGETPTESGFSGGGNGTSIDKESTGTFFSLINSLLGNDASTMNKNNSGTSDVANTVFYNYKYTVNYKTVTKEVVVDEVVTTNSNGVGGSTNLLSYPSLVETPFILFKVGTFTFGKYSQSGNNTSYATRYPNYIKSLQVSKLDGKLNTYTVVLQYQIATGNDPNFLDKIFSKVGYGKVYITYGDYSSPTFVYKEEEAIITKVTTKVDFSSNSILYTINCTSTATLLSANSFDFPAYTMEKPSTVIRSVLNNNQYGLLSVFTGMTNATQVANNNLIATDDKAVEIPAKTGMDPLSYINFLVSCMQCVTNSDEGISDSSYHISIYDDTTGGLNLNGTYFKIEKVATTVSSASSTKTYDIDIGFPTDNQVMSFNIENDNSWSLLYNYSDSIVSPQYVYKINNNGELVTDYSPNLMTSTNYNKMTETQKSWWTNMTQFPISATVVIKGLIRATILMSYMRVHALFFGQKHVSSGLYLITGQTDTVDEGGFRTTLKLQRIAGDNDIIQTTKKNVTSTIPTEVTVTKVEADTQSDEVQAAVNAQINNSIFSKIFNSISNSVTTYQTNDRKDNTQYAVTDGVPTNSSMYAVEGTNIDYNIWNVLINEGCTPAGAAGIMGNLWYESGQSSYIITNAMEYGLNRKIGNAGGPDYSNASYTAAIDNGTIGKMEFLFPLYKYGDPEGKYTGEDGKKHKCYGYGMVQWTTPDRKGGLYNLAKSKGCSISNASMQAEYMCKEIKQYSKVNNTCKTSSNIEDCCWDFYYYFESPSDKDLGRVESNTSWKSRRDRAIYYYNTYSGKTAK